VNNCRIARVVLSRQPSSIESDEFNGSRQMEALLQALRHDNNAGKVFRKHVDKSGNAVSAHALSDWLTVID